MHACHNTLTVPNPVPFRLPQQQVEMTVEAVDHALDDVRPYLIADGGNVEVVAVEKGHVFLQLQVSVMAFFV